MKKGFSLIALLLIIGSVQAQINANGFQGLYSGAFSSFGNNIPSVPTFTSKNQTIGNQYLFENWVKGTLVDVDGKVFSDGYLFNYNKVNQNIYFRLKDSAVAFLVNKSLVKSITLSDGLKTYTLEKVPAIDNENLYATLVKGHKYSLYSLTNTKFIAANFFTNGISSTGNMYDEFKDEVKYFLVTADGSKKEVPLKRKAVRKLLEAEKQKVDEFFKHHNTAGVFGEETLVSLVESISL